MKAAIFLQGICIPILASLLLATCNQAHAKDNSGRAMFQTLEDLQSAIGNHISEKRFNSAQWGIKVVSEKSGEVLFDHNGDALLKPASNTKLFSGALGLEKLGPGFRVKTSVFAKSRPNAEGTIEGDLVIYGRGDPSFSVRFNGGNYDTILQPLVHAITNAGVKEIRGKLLGDETYFQGPPFGSGWSWDDLQYYYGAEVSSLTVQDNVVDLFIKSLDGRDQPQISAKPTLHPLKIINRGSYADQGGSKELVFYRPVGELNVYATGKLNRTNFVSTDAVAVPKPGKWFLALLKDGLSRSGVKVIGETATASWPTATEPLTNNLEEIAFSLSPTYAEMLPKMMKPSQNLYSHLFLLQVGAQAAESKSTRETFTEDLGLAEMNQFMERIGVKKGHVFLEEGSGLSRGGLVTPGATVALLQYMRKSTNALVFTESLPIAGVDGTLRFRLRSEGLRKNVRAKTGTIRSVNTLSGYMKTIAGEDLIFSLFLNAYRPAGVTTAREDLDEVLELLYQYAPESTVSIGTP